MGRGSRDWRPEVDEDGQLRDMDVSGWIRTEFRSAEFGDKRQRTSNVEKISNTSSKRFSACVEKLGSLTLEKSPWTAGASRATLPLMPIAHARNSKKRLKKSLTRQRKLTLKKTKSTAQRRGVTSSRRNSGSEKIALSD